MAATLYPQKGIRGTGRRKEAIARVRVLPGTGKIVINGRSLEGHFGNRKTLHIPVVQPLVAAKVQDRYNLVIRTEGGGLVGQADAIRMGVARALASQSDELHSLMRAEGFLTRDPRVKESKKYGRKKARKRFQFSKR
jgi:small subunit ribosomal protein S9